MQESVESIDVVYNVIESTAAHIFQHKHTQKILHSYVIHNPLYYKMYFPEGPFIFYSQNIIHK